MKIAVTYQNGRTISGHAGRTNRFLIYTTENQKVIDKQDLELDKEQTFHNVFHNGLEPVPEHPLLNIVAIIAVDMGAGFFQKMKMNNIDAINTGESDPDIAIEKLLAGKLEVKPFEEHHNCK
jgi:predicted Fe-Mo cluster-binding NifX family protein